jgi:hypothetical protein
MRNLLKLPDKRLKKIVNHSVCLTVQKLIEAKKSLLPEETGI